MVITLAHAWAAFAILPIYVSLEKIDRSLLEAAADLGDGPVWRFIRVTLPLSLPGVLAASLVIFIPTVGDYITPTLVGGVRLPVMAGAIYQQVSGSFDWGFAAAQSALLLLATLLVVVPYGALAGRRGN